VDPQFAQAKPVNPVTSAPRHVGADLVLSDSETLELEPRVTEVLLLPDRQLLLDAIIGLVHHAVAVEILIGQLRVHLELGRLSGVEDQPGGLEVEDKPTARIHGYRDEDRVSLLEQRAIRALEEGFVSNSELEELRPAGPGGILVSKLEPPLFAPNGPEAPGSLGRLETGCLEADHHEFVFGFLLELGLGGISAGGYAERDGEEVDDAALHSDLP
jgi:hypothetical protein